MVGAAERNPEFDGAYYKRVSANNNSRISHTDRHAACPLDPDGSTAKLQSLQLLLSPYAVGPRFKSEHGPAWMRVPRLVCLTPKKGDRVGLAELLSAHPFKVHPSGFEVYAFGDEKTPSPPKLPDLTLELLIVRCHSATL